MSTQEVLKGFSFSSSNYFFAYSHFGERDVASGASLG